MGGHHGKHSDTGYVHDTAASSKITSREEPSKEDPGHSTKHGNVTLLAEKKFTIGNKAVKEQFIRDKVVDASCYTMESSKKTSNKTKLRSNVKNKDGTVCYSAKNDVMHPTSSIVNESHGLKEYESVKSCSPVKESGVYSKEYCPQTSTVTALSKEVHYLHYTIKSPKRVTTRPVIGAIDLIKMTHRQFEAKRDKNATNSIDKDNNINATKSDTKNDALSNSAEVRKVENIDRDGKMMSQLKDGAENTVTLKQKDPQASGKLPIVNNEQVTKYTRNSNVFQNAPHEPNLKLPGFRMKQSVIKSQDTKAVERLTSEKSTTTKNVCAEKMVWPTPVPSKGHERPHPVGRQISMGSETHEIPAAHVNEAKETPRNGMSLKSDEQIPSGTDVQKVDHKDGINLMEVTAVNEKKPLEKADVSCKTEVKNGSYNQNHTLEDVKDSMQLTKGAADPPDSLRIDTPEKMIAQDDVEVKSDVETETGRRIDESKDGPITDLNLEQTEDSKLGNREGDGGEVETGKEQAVSDLTQTSRKESNDQAQTVTKRKVNAREKTVKGRRRKVKLKPPLDYFKKQGVSTVTTATPETNSCHSTDGTAPSKPCEQDTHTLTKIAKSNNFKEPSSNFKEPSTDSGKEEKQASKSGTKPEQSLCQQGKKTLKSPSKVHPPRSPAGDSNSRIVDFSNQKPAVPVELKTVSGATQRQASNRPEEKNGLVRMEDPKDVNIVKNDKPDTAVDKHVKTAVEEDATKMEEASPLNDSRKKETKQGRRKNREKKNNKGDDECDGKSHNIVKVESKSKPVVTENVCLAQDVTSPERSKTIALPWTKRVIPKEKTDLMCDLKPKKKKVLVHEKEIRTEDDVIVKRRLRKAVRKGPIPKGQPTLMDIVFCQSCGDTKQPNGQGLFHCPKCKSVFYCTRACQHNDAKKHKKTCTGVKRVYCKHV